MKTEIEFENLQEIVLYIAKEFYDYEIENQDSISVKFGPHPLEAQIYFDDKNIRVSGLIAKKLKEIANIV